MVMTERKIKMIDLFAGCGGLEDGFMQSGHYIDVAAVEWLKLSGMFRMLKKE